MHAYDYHEHRPSCHDNRYHQETRPSPLKRCRTSEAILDTMGHKTAQVQFMVKSKLAAWFVPTTVLEANVLIRNPMDDDTQDTREDLADRLHSDRTLRRHMRLLDSALDAHLANRIGRLRE